MNVLLAPIKPPVQTSKSPNGNNYTTILIIAGGLLTIIGIYIAVAIPDSRWLAILFITVSWLGIAAWKFGGTPTGRERVGRTIRGTWRQGTGWKIAVVVGVLLVSFLFVLGSLIFLLSWLVKSLTVGGVRNLDLYLPRARRRR